VDPDSWRKALSPMIGAWGGIKIPEHSSTTGKGCTALQIDSVLPVKDLLQSQYHFMKGRISSPLTDSIDRDRRIIHSGFYGSQGVGCARPRSLWQWAPNSISCGI